MSTQSPSQGGFLPLELLETIVDVVGLEHLNQPLKLRSSAQLALNAICLTCRGTRPRSRKYLFRTVRFNYVSNYISGYPSSRPKPSRVQAFLALLTGAQGDALGAPIGVHVRVLRIEEISSPLFPQIIAFLPNLQEVCIKSDSADNSENEFKIQALWEVAGPNSIHLERGARDLLLAKNEEVKEAMKKLRDTRWLLPLSPLHLNRLHISANSSSSADVPRFLNFVLRCLHLETRAQTDLDEERWPLPDDTSAPRRKVSIRRLELDGRQCGGLVQFMMRPEYLRETLDNLEFLELCYSFQRDLHERSYLSLLSRCSASLRGLEVNLSQCPTDEYAFAKLRGLNLSTLQKLRHLNIVDWPRSAQAKLSSLPNGILSLLSGSGPSPSCLETIQISIQSETWRRYEPVDWIDSDGSWDRLKRLLVTGEEGTRRTTAFRNLTSIRVSFTLSDFVSLGGTAENTSEASLDAEREASKLLNLGDGIDARVILLPDL